VAVIDSFTHYILQYLETLGKSSKATLQDFVSPIANDQISLC
jgi:phosphatidylinositol glycan class K